MRALAIALLLGCSSPTTEAPVATDDSGAIATETATTDNDTSTPTSDTTTPEDTATVADTNTAEATVDTATPPTYPAGPYGTNVGNVIADLKLEGYVRVETTGLATSATYGPTSFAELRTGSARKHALIHVSGFT
jgi:hypothetical protein